MDCFSVMMEHVCDIYGPPVVTRDAGGGSQISWPTIRTTGARFLLNVAPAGAKDRFAQEQLIGDITGATFDTSVQRGDKLVVTSGPTLVGVNLHVTSIKSQPGVGALGFDPIVHIGAEHVV